MSRRSTGGGRSSRRSGNRGAGRRPAGRQSRERSGLDALFRDVLTATRGIAAADPLEVEVHASGLLSLSRGELHDPELDQAFADDLVRHLARAGTPDALALLHALAALIGPDARQEAVAAIGEVQAKGAEDPLWAAELAQPRVLDAWSATDELGDQTMVAVAFRHGFRHGLWPPHVVRLMVDHNFEGLVREASVEMDPARVRRAWAEAAPADLRPVDTTPQAAADLLAQGLRMFDLYLDPPVAQDARRLMPLLRARLRALPAPKPLPEPKPLTDAGRRRLVAAFLTAKLDLGTATLEDAELVASFVVDYGADYSGADPLRWSPIRVELLLLDWFPRKVLLESRVVRLVPDVLRAWARFCASRKGISDGGLNETLAAVDRFAPEFLEAMEDESTFGPAKSLFGALQTDGVDLTDQAAVAAKVAEYNAERAAAAVADAERRGQRRRKE